MVTSSEKTTVKGSFFVDDGGESRSASGGKPPRVCEVRTLRSNVPQSEARLAQRSKSRAACLRSDFGHRKRACVASSNPSFSAQSEVRKPRGIKVFSSFLLLYSIFLTSFRDLRFILDARLDARSDDQRLLQLSKLLFITRCTVRVRVECGLKIFMACLLSYKVCVHTFIQKNRNVSFSAFVWRPSENTKFITDPIELSCNNVRCFCGEQIPLRAFFAHLDLFYAPDKLKDFWRNQYFSRILQR